MHNALFQSGIFTCIIIVCPKIGVGLFKRTLVTQIVLRVVDNASVPGFLASPARCQIEMIGEFTITKLSDSIHNVPNCQISFSLLFGVFYFLPE